MFFHQWSQIIVVDGGWQAGGFPMYRQSRSRFYLRAVSVDLLGPTSTCNDTHTRSHVYSVSSAIPFVCLFGFEKCQRARFQGRSISPSSEMFESRPFVALCACTSTTPWPALYARIRNKITNSFILCVHIYEMSKREKDRERGHHGTNKRKTCKGALC